MKHNCQKYFSLIIILLLTELSISQVPDFSKVPNLREGDSLHIIYLIDHGVKITKQKAICWFPKDSLSEKRMNEIADTINVGVIAAEKFINAPLPWQVHSINEPYTFYFRLDSFISHASLYGFVSIPFYRIKNGRAPWLHEALHEILYSNTDKWFAPPMTDEYANAHMPLWIHEGLPDYIAIRVSRQNNLSYYDVFSNNDPANIDSLFVENLRSENGSYIISHIGANGIIPELFGKDRFNYAPGFYHGSCSFVQFIAERYRLNVLLTAISSFEKEQESIEAVSGKPLATLKKEWLDKLKIKQ